MLGELKTRETPSRSCYFGEWLLKRGVVDHKSIYDALEEQKIHGGRLGEILGRRHSLSPDELTNELAAYLDLEVLELTDKNRIDIDAARQIPESLARRFSLVLVGLENGLAVVAMSDPLNVVAKDRIETMTGLPLKVCLSSEEGISRAIEWIYHGCDEEERQLQSLAKIEIDEDEDFFKHVSEQANLDIEAAADDAPVIRFVNLLLSQAVKSRASDIHVEPQENDMSVRMRVDGHLRQMVAPPRRMQAAIIARVKILAEMNIAERRLPQDGRFKIRSKGRDIDVRVSTIPTIYGEKVVMRILDKSAVRHDLDRIGFDEELLPEFKSILSRPHGIIIVTGPTGSGKSTTLYSALKYLRDPRKNITTVEDPVEYRLKGINQIQVKPDINMDFALALRSILRQDPDIILIGEIRDKETMEIAMKASLTGHLVLSTFHTNDAASAFSRLRYMGLEPYLLASTVNLVVAQRLVRRICEHCRQRYMPDDETLAMLGIERNSGKIFYHGTGCKNCGGTGYRGRLPIFEFMVADPEISHLVIEGAAEEKIRSSARSKGYGGLFDSGLKRVFSGETTVEEILNVACADTSLG
ncbi:Type II traffic warden ATPase [Anaerohalosphaera lusitana]|uniref:Type II traffic warden ATPase n=1 Tax=Anaerohalosphaera lusitana TaxID=1936003 RepID=A0A1U9NPP4_9BACT|nr:ATPase, T2SS/T4P/T4SS family [Anaerohalosphaera lusitana]AQT69580.1 Type II traffic warden ATPase [Anaerohalosphaera lusitana]